MSIHRARPGWRHAVGAAVFAVGWLSFIAFLTLYRLPLPDEAFIHAAARIAETAH